MRGHINVGAAAALCLTMPVASFAQTVSPAQAVTVPASTAPVPAAATPAVATTVSAPSGTPAAASLILPEGTPVTVATETDISSVANHVGDEFKVTVVDDVLAPSGAVVIPKGTTGYGEVTFISRNRSFGSAGMLGITLRSLDLNGKSVLLDGHYRQEGKSADGAAAATYFAVGLFAALVKGKDSVIPKGRALKARTGQDIPYSPGAASTQPTAPTDPAAGAPPVAALPPTTDAKAQPAADQRSTTTTN